MGKCTTNIRDFHDKEVKLSEDDRKDIRTKADTNQRRIEKGLKDNKEPKPRGFHTQGSYAMRTMINRPNKDYDIDAGCYFDADDIKDIGPRALRRKVCEAADDGRFKTPPEVKKNCVRIVYDEGYHVDVPVYKLEEDDNGNMKAVLSSVDEWRASDPKGVTNWFNGEVKSHDPADLRKLVRLLKAFCPTSPSGLVLSVLASKLVVSDGDDDDMLHAAMKDLKAQLDLQRPVHHPVISGEVLVAGDSEIIAKLRKKLENALKELAVRDNSSTKSAELKAWKKVFGNCSFFDKAIEDAEKEEKESKNSDTGLRAGIVGAGGIGGNTSISATPTPVQARPTYAGEDE